MADVKAEKQKALAEAQEDLAYWTRVSNGEFEGLTDPARLAGPTLIKTKLQAQLRKYKGLEKSRKRHLQSFKS